MNPSRTGQTSAPGAAATALAGGVETLLNAWLRQDPEILERFGALQGQVLALDIEGTGLSLYFVPKPGGVQVLGHFEGEPDTRISGTPPALARLAAAREPGALFASGVRIEGDTALAQDFQDLLAGVDIDWEEQLSRLTGDVLAHQAGRAARAARGWLAQGADSLRRDLGEYLQEELRLLPTRVEVRNFLDDVDRLRDDLERLEARVRRLKAAREAR